MPHKWLVLATVMVGTFMGPLDGSVVNIALPTIGADFAVPITVVEWVVVVYLLMISTFLLTFGRLGDIIGLKSVYLAGFAVFTAGSLACALSWSIWALILFRAVQALGAGMLFSITPAIVTQTFPPSERGRALGMVGVAVAAGLAVGPSLGGAIIGLAGWQWIFLINLPVGVAAFAMAARFLPAGRPVGQRLDPFGTVLSFMALFPLLLVLSQGQSWGWSSPLVIGLAMTAAVGAVGFVVAELSVPQPVLDLRLFKIRLFSAALVSALCSYVVTSTVLFIMPFYLMQVRGYSVAHAGLLLTPVPFATAIVGLLSGALSDRIGSRILSTVGLGVSLVGALLVSGLSLTTTPAGIAGRLLVIGVGMGMFQAPNTNAVMGSVPRPRLGIASGTVAVARNVGMVLGISVAGFVLAVREPAHLEELLPTVARELAEKLAFLQAAHEAFYVAALVCAVGVVSSLVRGAPPRESPSDAQDDRQPSPEAAGFGEAVVR